MSQQAGPGFMLLIFPYTETTFAADRENGLKTLSKTYFFHSFQKSSQQISVSRFSRFENCEKNAPIEACKQQLQNKSFYVKVEDDPTAPMIDDIAIVIKGMTNKEYLSNNENKFLSENLKSPRMPIFYGLSKIHKIFDKFPPLRPIVSQVNYITYSISKYVDSFLKYQAQNCKSYIRDTKDFLNKLKGIGKLPEGAILVTMDVASLYTNISHNEGAQACYEKLETRKIKRVPSLVIKQLTMLVLSSNVFRFGNQIYKQIKGTAMGTPMAPNYANLFMDKFETELIRDFEQKHGVKPFLWYRYINDIFFIWTAGEDSLKTFINFAQDYSKNTNMESNIKFEVNSTSSVNFLDVTVRNNNGNLVTTLYTKPTDAHLYLTAGF